MAIVRDYLIEDVSINSKSDDLLQQYTKIKELYHRLNENIVNGQQLSKTVSWTYDVLKDESFFTEEIYHLLDCDPDQFDGSINQYMGFIHPDDTNKVIEVIQDTYQGKECDFEYRIITRNGIEKYIHEVTKAVYDDNNQLIKMFGIMQDITKEIKIKEDLKDLGDNLNSAQQVAGIGSFKYDALNDQIFWTKEVYRIYDVDPVDFDKNMEAFYGIMYAKDVPIVKSALEKCMTGISCELVHRIKKNRGQLSYIKVKGEPIYDKGKVIGIIGTVQDITDKKFLEDKLIESNNNLKMAQALAHIGSWEFDILNNKSKMSEEACRIYGITEEQFDGNYDSILKLIHPEDIPMFQDILLNPPKGNPFEIEFRVVREDGAVRHLKQLVDIKLNKKGTPATICGTVQDITEKKELEKDLLFSKEIMYGDSRDFYEVIDWDGTIIYLSHKIEDITWIDTTNMAGDNIFDFFNEEQKQIIGNMLKALKNNEGKKIVNDINIQTRLGKELKFQVTMVNQILDSNVKGIALYWHDITERTELENRISFLATHDELTKLPNRVYFQEKVYLECEEAKKAGGRFALIMLDVDGFKYINDALGYQLADELVFQISQRLSHNLGQNKFLCRYSGDQFVILVKDLAHRKDYEIYAKKVLSLFTEPFKIGKYELYVTVSMGVSIFPEDGQDVDTLKKHANMAMYRSKGEGNNRYRFYSQDMDVRSFKEFELRNDLKSAIKKKQLRVYFQPIVNLVTGEIIAAESLLRWEHPSWGIVSPGEFIPIAEETGLIIEIGKWILTEVCRIYKEWLQNGLPEIKISINYSGIQFYEKNFVDNIFQIIKMFGLDPHFMILEIVESVLINDMNRVVSDLQRLQKVGIQIALDDFGTGYSSLEYLHRFHIDILKIDRSFINNLGSEETGTIITEHVISLAKKLQIKMVSEGIETWQQLQLLRKFNCFAGQGYLYSKPLAQTEFEKVLVSGKCIPGHVNIDDKLTFEDRRMYNRVILPRLLEASMTIIEIGGKATRVGSTKVILKNIGSGGLCFLSNVNFPIKRDIVLQFTTELMGKKIRVYGYPVWTKKVQESIYEYGIEFSFSEKERTILTGILNRYQIRLRNKEGQYDGPFIFGSYLQYFNLEEENK